MADFENYLMLHYQNFWMTMESDWSFMWVAFLIRYCLIKHYLHAVHKIFHISTHN